VCLLVHLPVRCGRRMVTRTATKTNTTKYLVYSRGPDPLCSSLTLTGWTPGPNCRKSKNGPFICLSIFNAHLVPSVSGVPSRLEEPLVAPALWERLVLTNQYTFSVAIGPFPAPTILTRFSAYLPTVQQKPIVSTAEPIALTVGTYLSDSAGEAVTSGFET
jgi:hypothetical protein